MLVKVKYFGMILEQVKTDSELLTIEEHSSIKDVESVILAKYPGIKNITYNIALNLSIKDTSTLLNNGDELAFLPPFAGG
ncbi:MoaD/ThiS family protein [Wenyingzhuangia sp. IMCC45574]